MDKIRVLVIDDSPFSQRVMSKALTNGNFEVCGLAATGWEGVEQYRCLQPDAVTMDMTLPDIDGLVCSREILKLDPSAKIIMVSAMKDEGLIAQGYTIGIQAFMQKPPKPAELLDVITQVCKTEQDDKEWDEKYLEHFVQALGDNLLGMAGLEYQSEFQPDKQSKFHSQGIAIIIGITGKQQGRVILDVSEDTASAFASLIFGTPTVSEEDMLNSMAEFANIICGHGVSQINNMYRGLELRLTPPSVLSGKKISIVNPRLNAFIVTATTEIGVINMSVGFAGGK